MLASAALVEEVEIRHFHFFCGIGGGALGFNRGRAEVGNRRAKFRCIGGIDVDAKAIRDFDRRVGVRGTVLDLFDRAQYTDFHGSEPPASWKEATPEDIKRAAGYEYPHIVFLSAPCKGFSGLLSEHLSKTTKYQALNRLTLRGIWLMLEAFADHLPELILFENVPRIATRGRSLLDQIAALLRRYGYAIAETTHDCGELGGLAQSRRRFLLVARRIEAVPPFLYEPVKRPLRAVGDVLGRMPLPGDPASGPMHLLPNLQWKTWVRLAFVEAGSDWRSLNKLAVADGYLKDFLIVPEAYNDVLGVLQWQQTSGAVSGRGGPTNGAYSVADPRIDREVYSGYGVSPWDKAARTVQGESFPSNGQFAVADPRFEGVDFGQYGVRKWEQPTGVVTSQRSPGQGTFSVADPRLSGVPHHNVFRITKWNDPRGVVTSGHGPSSGAGAVADPRPPAGPLFGKYTVSKWEGYAGTVIGGDDSGAYAVADPRMPDSGYEKKKYKVTSWTEPSRTVISGSTTGEGAFAVADPRINRGREHYKTASEYGVLPWDQTTGAVQALGQYDNGRWSVADPRIQPEPRHPSGGPPWDSPTDSVADSSRHANGGFSVADQILPAATDKLVAVIRALDGTWHRPFTTLELAALQSLVDPDEMFTMEGKSDSDKRERIGNAVPPCAAQAIADVMGTTLLLAMSGETFTLSSQPIWVRPVAVALSVKNY
jgi:site-specific DNA-cytosine methylase